MSYFGKRLKWIINIAILLLEKFPFPGSVSTGEILKMETLSK
jgi:hypothetical protein